MKNKTIETMTADTILQRVQTIKIGGVDYIIAPPTLATLILVSEEVSHLPKIEFKESSVIEDGIRSAKDYKALADIVAILILGANRLVVEEEYTKRVLGIFKRKCTRKVDMKARITEAMLNVELSELTTAVTAILQTMQFEHFFALASFLTNINLTKATRKEAKTTAYGR